jgi:hypothetical protein
MQFAINTSNNVIMNVVSGGVSLVTNLGSGTTSTTYKTAAALQTANYADTVNGNVPTTSSAVGIPTVDRLKLGANPAGTGGYLNGHIQSIKYYPTRLPNGTLQGLTA